MCYLSDLLQINHYFSCILNKKVVSLSIEIKEIITIKSLAKMKDFRFIETGVELYGLNILKDYMLDNGYVNFSFRKSCRPTQGSPVFYTNALINNKIQCKIYKPKTTKLSGDTIVLKTDQGYFEFWKLNK